MNRINGYRNIGEYQKVNKKVEESLYAKAWYTDGKEEYLFKKEGYLTAYKELFYSIFLRYLNMSSVEIDLAVLGRNFGIISKNYNPTHFPCYSIEYILDKYWTEIIRRINEEQQYHLVKILSYEQCYNLKRLPEIIGWFLNKHHLKFGKEIYNECLKQFIVQIIGGNIDLRAQNMEIYIEEKAKFSPFYDFGSYGEINLKKHHNFPFRFQNRPMLEGEKVSPEKTIRNFLKNANKEDIEMFKEYLELAKIAGSKTDIIFREMQEQISQEIPDKLKLILKNRLVNNIENMDTIVKN